MYEMQKQQCIPCPSPPTELHEEKFPRICTSLKVLINKEWIVM
jgi:hypothetical protein